MQLWLPTPEWKMRRWDVRLVDLEAEELWGDCCHTTRVIRLDKNADQYHLLAALLHEQSHATAGDEETKILSHEQGTLAALEFGQKRLGITFDTED